MSHGPLFAKDKTQHSNKKQHLANKHNNRPKKVQQQTRVTMLGSAMLLLTKDRCEEENYATISKFLLVLLAKTLDDSVMKKK